MGLASSCLVAGLALPRLGEPACGMPEPINPRQADTSDLCGLLMCFPTPFLPLGLGNASTGLDGGLAAVETAWRTRGGRQGQDGEVVRNWVCG